MNADAIPFEIHEKVDWLIIKTEAEFVSGIVLSADSFGVKVHVPVLPQGFTPDPAEWGKHEWKERVIDWLVIEDMRRAD